MALTDGTTFLKIYILLIFSFVHFYNVSLCNHCCTLPKTKVKEFSNVSTSFTWKYISLLWMGKKLKCFNQMTASDPAFFLCFSTGGIETTDVGQQRHHSLLVSLFSFFRCSLNWLGSFLSWCQSSLHLTTREILSLHQVPFKCFKQ